jgi:two-component system sensor histidine kinase QseC
MKGYLIAPARWTMQSQLIVIAMAIALLAWVAGVLVMGRAAESEAGKLHDAELRQVARLLMGLSAHELDEMGTGTPLEAVILNGRMDTEDVLGNDYRYQLWSKDGHLLLSNFGRSSSAAMAAFERPGFSELVMDGERWRVYALHDADSGKEIQVAERLALRQWAITAVDKSLPLFVVLSLCIVMIPALWLLRRLLRPLRELSSDLKSRIPSRLEPLQVHGASADLVPVINSINGLFHRVEETLQRERGFTGVAAHELRTPLAALRVLAMSASQTSDDSERHAILADLVLSVDRCAHLQTQLLALARLDVLAQDDMEEVFDLIELFVDVQAQLAPEARQRGVKLIVRADDTVLRANRFGVLTLLGNLVANAIRYTPSGGRIVVSSSAEGADAMLEVLDSGPGIPEADHEHVFERFSRLKRDQSSGVSGVGLGLAIVRSVAEAHQAMVSLATSPMGGLKVVVRFQGRRVGSGQVDLLAPNGAPEGSEYAGA